MGGQHKATLEANTDEMLNALLSFISSKEDAFLQLLYAVM